MEQFIGEIKIFSIGFSPRDWAPCDGRILQINSNRDLYDILQNYYGGDPSKGTFALPDLRGRLPVGFGAAGTGTNYPLGQSGGIAEMTIAMDQMPKHSHDFKAYDKIGEVINPADAYFSDSGEGDFDYSPLAVNTTMAPKSIGSIGGGVPVDIYQPYLGINFVIALKGIRPIHP